MTEEQKEQFIKDYPNIPNKELSKKYGITYNTAVDIGSNLKIKKNYTQNKNKLKILLDKSIISYYWLGFIMADGYVNKVGELTVSLQKPDMDHLEKLAKYLDAKITINDNPKQYGKTKRNPFCSMCCTDIVYGIEIRKTFGIVDKKTYTAISLDFVNTDDTIVAFLCGLIDGDGHMGIATNKKLAQIKIMCHSSWLPVYQNISEKLLKIGIESKAYEYDIYTIFRISHRKNLRKIYHYAKSLNIPLMNRKWDICETILN